ncbi:MAG: hypothetical protein HY681_09210 [Chloroflexi bacterium]|nr:hypothetical protein [Chloroflexota bacterium]
MATIVKIRLGDKEYQAIEQSWEIGSEPWSEYKLADGGLVRVRTTVQKIFRILDDSDKPAFNADGDPFFLVRHTTQVVGRD